MRRINSSQSIQAVVRKEGRNRVVYQRFHDVLRLLEGENLEKLLDLGCADGTYTVAYAGACGAKQVVGIDIHAPSILMARKLGIEALHYDLNMKLPFRDGSFDAVIATQVIEHLPDCDHFAAEMYRVLKPGGCSIVATDNLSSWSNVASLILGYQPHAESVSRIRRIGNPFSGNYGEVVEHDGLHHHHVFTLRSLVELLELHGFTVVGKRCTGYFPAPARFSGILSKVDPIHSRYVTLKATRR